MIQWIEGRPVTRRGRWSRFIRALAGAVDAVLDTMTGHR